MGSPWPICHSALGVALTGLLVLPNALWQIGHGLPILEVLHNDQLNRHAYANGLADESASRWLNALYMLAAQLLLQNAFLSAIWIWGLAWLWRTPYRFLTVAYLLLLGLLVLTIGRGYYIEGIYPALFAAGAVAIERTVGPKPALRASVAFAVAAVGLFFVPLVLPVLNFPTYLTYERAIGLSRPAQPGGTYHLIDVIYADQLGWRQMTETVARVYWSLPPAQRARTAIFADRYDFAGALNYYGPRYGLPTAISPNNSYYLWGTRGYSGSPTLAVGATDYRMLRHWFGSVRQVAVYRNDYRWILEGPLPVYLCTRPSVPLRVMWPSLKYYGL